jgi:hypothetical protein
VAGALVATAAAPAHAGPFAGQDDLGRRLTVCAESLGVRWIPGGVPFDYLHYPETFTVEGFDSGYVYGLAFGHINRHVYVQNGWFCDA